MAVTWWLVITCAMVLVNCKYSFGLLLVARVVVLGRLFTFVTRFDRPTFISGVQTIATVDML